MKGKAIIPLVLGLGMGFFAIKMGINMIQKAKGASVDTYEVVVAATPIEAGAKIEPQMLRVTPVPKTLVPPGAFGKAETVVGRVAFLHVATGLPVSQEMLAPEGTQPGMPSQIPDGYRALAVKVDEATAVAGFVMPGHRVDIYSVDMSVTKGRKAEQPVSRLLLEDVQVGAVGQSTKTVDPDGKTTKLTRSVTVYVKPEAVPALDVASRGPIRLVLRGSSEPKAESRPRFAEGLSRFFQELQEARASIPPIEVTRAPEPAPVVAPAVVAAPQADPYSVMVYRGREVETLNFKDADSTVRLNDAAMQQMRQQNRMNQSSAAPPAL